MCNLCNAALFNQSQSKIRAIFLFRRYLNPDLNGRQVSVFRRVSENDDHPLGDDVGRVAHRVHRPAELGLTRRTADQATTLESYSQHFVFFVSLSGTTSFDRKSIGRTTIRRHVTITLVGQDVSRSKAEMLSSVEGMGAKLG